MDKYNIFGIEFKNLNNLFIYLENSNSSSSGLKRIEEEDKVIYIKGNNVSPYQREYESVLTLEPLILMDMRNRKEKKVYIEFPSRAGYGIIFPKILIEQNNNFDPYPDTSKILDLKTDSRTEYFKTRKGKDLFWNK